MKEHRGINKPSNSDSGRAMNKQARVAPPVPTSSPSTPTTSTSIPPSSTTKNTTNSTTSSTTSSTATSTTSSTANVTPGLLDYIKKGHLFTKFDANGASKIMLFYRNSSKTGAGYLHWRQQGSSIQDKADQMQLKTLKEIVGGKQSTVLLSAVARDADTGRCFTLRTKKGDLDLMAENPEAR
jgi:hypothetical protein